jgi:hypothetical protein
VLLSVTSDAKFINKDGLTALVAPRSRIDTGSPIFLNLVLSILSGVVILLTGAPYVVVLSVLSGYSFLHF